MSHFCLHSARLSKQRISHQVLSKIAILFCFCKKVSAAIFVSTNMASPRSIPKWKIDYLYLVYQLNLLFTWKTNALF